MDWILFLHVFTVVNKVLLFPLYFFRKNNSRANRMLACLIILPAFPIISNYIFYTRLIAEFPNSLFASQILFSFFGPIYLFYCLEMLGKPFTFTFSKLGHALPSLCLLILWLVYIFSSPASQVEFAQSLTKYDDVTWQMVLSCWMPIILVLIYISIASCNCFPTF